MLGEIVQGNLTEVLVFGPVILASDHITGATGKALTVTISKNGGAFAAPAGAVTEVGNGIYAIAASALDADTLGILQIHATGAGCDPYDDRYDVEEAPVSITLAAALAPTVGTTTGYSLIVSALRKLNALQSGEVPDADEASDALEMLNDLIDGWALQDFIIYFLLRTVVNLAASTASYTIGSGGAINIARPIDISAAGLILNTGLTPIQEVPITVLTDQAYIGVPQKTYSSTYPDGIYYDHGNVLGLGTIYPLPIPNQALSQLVLYTPQALTEMTLAGGVSFPPGYRRLLKLALARELAPEFGGWDGAKEMLYTDALRDVKDKNLRMSDLSLGRLPTFGGLSNIYTGQA